MFYKRFFRAPINYNRYLIYLLLTTSHKIDESDICDVLFENRITSFDDSDANENYTPHTQNININIEEFSDNVKNLNLDYILTLDQVLL